MYIAGVRQSSDATIKILFISFSFKDSNSRPIKKARIALFLIEPLKILKIVFAVSFRKLFVL